MARLLSRLPHRLALASLLALSLLLNACGPTDRPRVTDYRSQGELRVATRHDAISYRIDDEGHASGFEHELLLALGDALGVPVKFVPYPDAARALDAVINVESSFCYGSIDGFIAEVARVLRPSGYPDAQKTRLPPCARPASTRHD